MHVRILSGLAALLLAASLQLRPAWAENAMGYKLLTAQDAARLPRNHGALGLDVEREQQITDSGMTFDIIRVKQVRPGSAGAKAGFNAGDKIIAVDGQVFPSIAAFASYVGSVQPGRQISVDTIPAGGGPAQAERISVVVGAAGAASPTAQQAPQAPQTNPGLSTGTKLAIGVGAAALLKCYQMGCFSHGAAPAPQPPQ
jgi:membrane-associated protease RseP (regulator of RpoE activity)